MKTPWGESDHEERLSDEIIFYGTPSHGGYHVTGASLEKIPEQFREGFAGYGWFEEDCDWAIVAMIFPEYFTPEQLLHAVSTLRMYNPEACQVLVGISYEEYLKNIV